MKYFQAPADVQSYLWLVETNKPLTTRLEFDVTGTKIAVLEKVDFLEWKAGIHKVYLCIDDEPKSCNCSHDILEYCRKYTDDILLYLTYGLIKCIGIIFCICKFIKCKPSK